MMRQVWVAPGLCMLLATGCASAHAARAQALLRAGKPEQAVQVWNERLAQMPGDREASEGRRIALSEQALQTYQGAASALGEDTDLHLLSSRLEALARVDVLIADGATPPQALEATRNMLGNWVRTLVESPLGLGQALEARGRLASVEAALRAAGLGPLAADLTQQLQQVGARRCLVLTRATRTPWLGAAVARFCDLFQVRGPQVTGFPERRARLELRQEAGALKGAAPNGPLGLAVQAAFDASVWRDQTSSGAALGAIQGLLDSQLERTPMEMTTSWTETEPYTTTEQQTEHYQESYTTTEQRPVQVPYTAYESYTYSCGTGTRYMSCTGTRSVLRYRTEYRSEMVTKQRPASRQVTKTVTRYRPVSRSFVYPGIHFRAQHTAQLKVWLALPALTVPLEIKWSDSLSATDVEHSTTHAPAHLTPHRAEVPAATDWETHAAQALQREVGAALDSAWVNQFCAEVASAEAAARCVASPRAPEAPWAVLSTYFGEGAAHLRVVMRGP